MKNGLLNKQVEHGAEFSRHVISSKQPSQKLASEDAASFLDLEAEESDVEAAASDNSDDDSCISPSFGAEIIVASELDCSGDDTKRIHSQLQQYEEEAYHTLVVRCV